MSLETLKSHFTFPLGKQGLKQGPQNDYIIKVGIGGGKKTATVIFQDPSHRDRVSDELIKVAESQGVELTLDIAA